MNSFIFIICLSFIFFLPGTMSYNNYEQEVVLTNGSTMAFLPCYIPGAQQIVWKFKSFSGDKNTTICTMDEHNKQCNSSQFPNIKLANSDGFSHGNYSLHFKAANIYAGIYYCTNGSTNAHGKEFRLISFNVSATPENAIRQGDPVTLMVETSDDSYFCNRAWNVSNNQVKGEGIEILWMRNNELINKNSRFQFDYRSLNISELCSKDEGRYVYTVKLSNGKSAYYITSLQISDQSSTTTASANTTISGQNSTATTSAETETSDQNSGATAPGDGDNSDQNSGATAPGDGDNSDQSSTATTSTEAKTSGQNSGTTAPGEGGNSDQSSTATTSTEAKTSGQNSGTTAPGEGDNSGISAGAWIASFLLGTLGIMIIIILVSIIIKKKCTSSGKREMTAMAVFNASEGDRDTVQATTMDDVVPYATINLAALTDSEPSAPGVKEDVLYAEVKAPEVEPATNEISV